MLKKLKFILGYLVGLILGIWISLSILYRVIRFKLSRTERNGEKLRNVLDIVFDHMWSDISEDAKTLYTEIRYDSYITN